MVKGDRWAGVFGLVRLFSPPVPPRFFFPAFCEFFCPAPGFMRLLLLCFLGGSFHVLSAQLLHLLHLLTRFNHRINFVDGIMMPSFFTPRGAPHHSTTPRHPASARALSLSLLLGLSPLAGITPAALATPTQTASDQPTQVAPAQADPKQATPPPLQTSRRNLTIRLA